MSKKIVVLTGSPKDNGNSFAMTAAFINSAEAKGHKVVRFDTAKKTVGGCLACNSCFSKGKACVNDDDFNEMASDIFSADAIVLTSPLYWYTFSAKLKAVIDKFYAFCIAEENMSKFKGKECGLIVACEDSDPTAMDGIVASYEHIAHHLEWKSLGTVLIHGVLDPGDINKTDGITKAKDLAEKF